MIKETFIKHLCWLKGIDISHIIVSHGMPLKAAAISRQKGVMYEMLVQIAVSVAAAAISLSTIAFVGKSVEVKRLREEKLLLERSRDGWEEYYRDYIRRLEVRIDRLVKVKSCSTNILPNTIKAVKYAMIRAHPDNGGKEEDFIMFQKLYKELTKNG